MALSFGLTMPGFLGAFRLVFSNGAERITVRVIVLP